MFLVTPQRSFNTITQSMTLFGDSVEDMLDTVDHGRGLECSVPHVSQDFTDSETTSIAVISFCEDDTTDVNGLL